MSTIDPRSYSAPAVFAAEMTALRAHAWQLIGLTEDFPADGIPVPRQLFAREMKVWREGDAYRAGWSTESVETESLRAEAVGRFVFATAMSAGTLDAYLGVYADYLRAASPLLGDVVLRESVVVAANWKLLVEITLDDYHLATVHPTTFGADAVVEAYRFVYRRDGDHSCYLRRRDADWSFDGFWRDLPQGVVDRAGYKIFQMFPCALVAGMYEGLICGGVDPIAPDRSRVTNVVLSWSDRARDEAQRRALTDYVRTFLAEDYAACAQWQTGVGRLARAPTFGILERRVGWFHDSYQTLMKGAAGPP